MNLVTVKIIALSLLGGISLILGFIPVKLKSLVDISELDGNRNFWKRTITSVLLCFGGGVLLATSFVHMLPEVRESIESTSYHIDGIPAAEILFCCGFFLIYFIEEIVHCICDAKVDHDDEATLHVHKTFTVHSRACEAGVTDMQVFGSQESLAKSTCSSSPLVSRRSSALIPSCSTQYNTFGDATKVNFNGGSSIEFDQPSTSKGFEEQHSVTLETIPDTEPVVAPTMAASISDGHSHYHMHHQSSLRDFLTVLALSCHAIFEGLAIGLENDSESVWTLFAAVATHKYVISFCVGLELVTAKTPFKLFAVYMSVFALVSPLGVAIGIGISSGAGSGGDSYTLTVAILQALAGGTLIYVVVFEVLQREKSKSVSGMAQLTFVILGFSVLMCIEIFAGHKHGGHDHEHEASTSTPEYNATVHG